MHNKHVHRCCDYIKIKVFNMITDMIKTKKKRTNFDIFPANLTQIAFYVSLLRSGKKGLRKDTLCDFRAWDCHSCSANGKVCVCPLRV